MNFDGDSAHASEPLPRLKWTSAQVYVAFILLLVEVVSQVGKIIISVLQIPIQRDLHLSDSQLGLMLGPAFFLSFLVVTMPVARWAERASRPKIMSLALLLRAAAMAAYAFVGSFPQLLVARVGIGAGDGGSQPLLPSMVADHFSARQRGMAMSFVMTGLPLGNFLGPLLGGLLSDRWGWRLTFLACAVPALLLAPLVRFTVSDRRLEEPGHTVTKMGSLRGPTFISDIKLLASYRPLLLYWAGTSLFAMEIAGTNLFTASYFMRQFGLSMTQTAWLTGLGLGVTGLFGTMVGGFIADRFADSRGRSYVYTTAGASLLAGLFFLLTFTRDTFTTAAAMMVIANFCTALKNGPLHAGAQNMSPPRLRATTASLIWMGAVVCAALGPLVVGLVSDSTAASTFNVAGGDFQTLCIHGRKSELAAATAAACKFSSAEGMRMGLMVVSSIYFASTALLIASAIKLKEPLRV